MMEIESLVGKPVWVKCEIVEEFTVGDNQMVRVRFEDNYFLWTLPKSVFENPELVAEDTHDPGEGGPQVPMPIGQWAELFGKHDSDMMNAAREMAVAESRGRRGTGAIHYLAAASAYQQACDARKNVLMMIKGFDQSGKKMVSRHRCKKCGAYCDNLPSPSTICHWCSCAQWEEVFFYEVDSDAYTSFQRLIGIDRFHPMGCNSARIEVDHRRRQVGIQYFNGGNNLGQALVDCGYIKAMGVDVSAFIDKVEGALKSLDANMNIEVWA